MINFDLKTSAGGRGYLARLFREELKRHDFNTYIQERIAADFACVMSEWLDGVLTGRDQLRLDNERLRGLMPDLTPRPPEGNGLPRYGLRWNGPGLPLSVPMDDGYWTPWHLASAENAGLFSAFHEAAADASIASRKLTACEALLREVSSEWRTRQPEILLDRIDAVLATPDI